MLSILGSIGHLGLLVYLVYRSVLVYCYIWSLGLLGIWVYLSISLLVYWVLESIGQLGLSSLLVYLVSGLTRIIDWRIFCFGRCFFHASNHDGVHVIMKGHIGATGRAIGPFSMHVIMKVHIVIMTIPTSPIPFLIR